jgi:hypothetical protein
MQAAENPPAPIGRRMAMRQKRVQQLQMKFGTKATELFTKEVEQQVVDALAELLLVVATGEDGDHGSADDESEDQP